MDESSSDRRMLSSWASPYSGQQGRENAWASPSKAHSSRFDRSCLKRIGVTRRLYLATARAPSMPLWLTLL